MEGGIWYEHITARGSTGLKDGTGKALTDLKNNRDKVPLQVLKSKYKTGYDALCKNISHTASEYAKQVSLHDIRIHKDYLEEGVSIINQSIEASGLLKELSKAAFLRQDITEFTNLAEKLRGIILEALEPFTENIPAYTLPPSVWKILRYFRRFTALQTAASGVTGSGFP